MLYHLEILSVSRPPSCSNNEFTRLSCQLSYLDFYLLPAVYVLEHRQSTVKGWLNLCSALDIK
jgi:hypothetical protein